MLITTGNRYLYPAVCDCSENFNNSKKYIYNKVFLYLIINRYQIGNHATRALLSASANPSVVNLHFKMFGAVLFIDYINRSIATKVDSTYLGY